MQTLVELNSGEQFAAWEGADGIGPVDRAQFANHAADAHFLWVDGDRVPARCSIWTRHTPTLPGYRVGLIGHYAAADASAGRALLTAACSRLAAVGCTIAIGPMDGSTWRRYRLVTSRGDEPPFFLEPDNPGDWPQHFAAAGFDVLSRYCSTRLDDLGAGDARMPQALQRLSRAGVTIRPIDLSRFEEELRQVHTLSLDAFAGNFLYTPIRCEQFLAMYRPLREHLRRETVLLTEQAGELLGFVFGIPDLAQAQRGEAVDTIIIKTVAVRPGVRLAAGLGSILVDQCQQAAKRLGMGRAIHALMHENNRSRQIARGGGRLIREYALFARRLTP